MKPITIIGAGNSGFAMAGHLLSAGHQVRMWNRPGKDVFTAVRQAGGIRLTGAIRGRFMPAIMTRDIAKAITGADLILVTVPASAHASVVKAMLPHLEDGQTVLLNPGRTCGALECHAIAKQSGCGKDVTFAETETIVYTCRKTGPDSAAILAFKTNVLLAAFDPTRTRQVIRLLPECIRDRFIPAASTLETSLGNVGMILHCSPVLFNIGWIETERTNFKYYYEGITPSVAAFLEKLDAERLEVGRRCGIDIPSVAEWMRRSYGVQGKNLYECIQANASYARIDAPQTLQHRYLFEDVPTGLVPLEAIGQALGCPVTLTTTIIDLANRLVESDFRECGRNGALIGLSRQMPAGEVIAAISGTQ